MIIRAIVAITGLTLAGCSGAPMGGGAGGADGVQYVEVGPNAVLPYGQIGRACDVSKARLGTEIARYPDSGRGYAIHDSAPGQTGQRTFYVTGFKDGCARQVTAALAMFGHPDTYEMIRFGAPSRNQPLAATDAAYDRIKRALCRVKDDAPCGDRLGRLARDTVFISLYERHGSNPRWKNLLLHDGDVVALDIKSR
ncbi:hypothetical protein [Citreimonas salinaria]|uniref:Uncharacterized protein n=1 Tax=Citreimonas salinaria TaxID=321339 RepID=A0A1H3JBQ0_9RHOB|nr:hypothetical protein [Citreimonas salinaria]SDY37009.1 hypothetical protein SAMN05444340_106169 [Citreimonas salinaria]